MLTNIFGSNICQLQTSLKTANIVHLVLFTIPYKMHSPCNVPCLFGVLTIIIHIHIRRTIQYNHRRLLWNFIWILVHQFMN